MVPTQSMDYWPGTAQHLSFHDVQIVNAMYKCKEKCANVDCPKGAFVGKNCECFCQGPIKDPVQRCNHPKVFCEAPDIDLDIYYVFSEDRKALLRVLSGTSYPDGTVLIVEDQRCSKHETGNFTCKNGRWVGNVNCKPDRCVYNTSRYDFTPSITADERTEYVNSGTIVHVKCVSPNAIPGYDSECTDSLWIPELPNCDAALKCPDVSYIADGISHQVIWKNPENTYQSVIRYGCDVARLSVGKKGLDVIFLMDTSSSFGPASLELAKEFTKMIVNIYGVSASADGGNGTRFALITFDHFANLFFNLDDSTVRSVDAVIKKINEIKSTDGGKCLINALDLAHDKIYFRKLHRDVAREVPDTNRAVFILTDSAIDTCPKTIHFIRR
ncbi:uncharacterized protein LOC127838236 [Dreissena polymorpha]|uniref:uncharacterized protein LOC127838236 n=1 Tax=Dreissena polymorpha TaxID=45954 RepID=UPI002264C16A|nr:uncharacterized protein LOC127838236 [Dreissena polymorpha]